MERVEADVCVVGAGFAGLVAARRLTGSGLSTAVLEARERVGGRTHTEVLPGGTPIDHGGAWLGPGQDAAYELAAEVGVGTYPTYCEGESVYVKDGTPRRYRGTVPLAIGVLQLANLGVAMKRLDRMARQIPHEAPWNAPRAAAWDAATLGGRIDRNVAPGRGRRVLRSVLKDLYTAVGRHGDVDAQPWLDRRGDPLRRTRRRRDPRRTALSNGAGHRGPGRREPGEKLKHGLSAPRRRSLPARLS